MNGDQDSVGADERGPVSANGLALEAGGVRVVLEGDAGLLAVVRERCRNFVSPPEQGAAPMVRLELRRDDRLGYASPFDVLTEHRGDHLRLYNSALDADINLASGRGAARVAGPGGVSTATRQASLENLLRVLWARLAVERGLVLVHAAAAWDPDLDGAFLFYGPSGAGKTTASRLSAASGRTVFSDDIVLVGPAAGGGVVHATPFWGDVQDLDRRPRRARLLGLAELDKGPEHELRPHAPVEAVTALLGSTPFTETLDTVQAGRLLDLLAALCAQVPSFRLAFRKDAGFWKLLAASGPGLPTPGPQIPGR